MDKDQTGWTARAPFGDLLGPEVVSAAAGVAEFSFTARPEFTNRKGDIHGGVIASLVDMAASAAVRSREELKGLSTMNLSVNYLEPAGSEIRVIARVIKAGRSTAWVDVQAKGTDDTIVATASLLLRLIR